MFTRSPVRLFLCSCVRMHLTFGRLNPDFPDEFEFPCTNSAMLTSWDACVGHRTGKARTPWRILRGNHLVGDGRADRWTEMPRGSPSVGRSSLPSARNLL